MRAIPWGFAAAAIGTVAGAAISSSGAQSAASTEAQAADQSSQEQLQMFEQTQANEQPFVAAGTNALTALQQGIGVGPNGTGTGTGPLNAPYNVPYNPQYQASPGYQFQMQQGQGAINNAASASGGVVSGNTLKALTQFGQGVANQDYNSYLNNYNTQYWDQYNAYVNQQNQQFGQLQTLAGSGQNAAANLGSLGTQVGSSVGNNIVGAGNASAAGTVASSNTIGNSLNSLGSNYLLFNALNGNNGGASVASPFINYSGTTPTDANGTGQLY